MLTFFQTYHSLFLILISIIGFLAGFIICKLAFDIPQNLLKNWRIQSWAYLYPQREIPSDITHISTVKRFTFVSWHCLGLALGNAWLSLLIADHFGFNYATAATLILMWGLLLLACIDFKHYLLPDCLTLPLLWLGLFCNTFELFISTHTAVWGAMIGYLSLWIIALLFKYVRGIEGIGQGDFKLLALFGAWWGFKSLPMILMIASLSGSAIGFVQILCGRHHLHKPVAFGPYLIFSALILLFFHLLPHKDNDVMLKMTYLILGE